MTLWDSSMCEFIQQVAEAVSTVLRLDVTVVECGLTRVAGTGRYSRLIGEKLVSSCAFAETMRTGKPCLITDPRRDSACEQCEAEGECVETCHMAYPLMLEDKPIGVIGLICFTEEQRQRLIDRSDDYVAFIEQMARLVESTARNVYVTQELKKSRDQLTGIVDAVDDGIIAVNDDGTVLCCNQAASAVLNLAEGALEGKKLDDVLGDAPILEVVRTRTPYDEKEVTVSSPSGRVKYISNGSVLYSDGRMAGAVELLKSSEDARRFAYHVSTRQPDQPIDNILGKAPALMEAKEMALSTAASFSTVLLIGESGTGKELFARAIHYHSARRSGPFVAVNCAAMPEELLDSELFGYEEGAFTGARKGGKPGKFELAHGGTLFLDEVADCSLRLQAKLLRALDRGEICRVGGTQTITSNARIIAATNKDLERLARQGEFREDLYFRLSVIPIRIPPLRERRTDIIPLFIHFLHKHAVSVGRDAPVLSEDVERILLAHDWPGNIRQLENATQYVLHTCSSKTVEPCHLPVQLTDGFAKHDSVDEGVAASGMSKRAFSEIMSRAEWERMAIAEGLKQLGQSAQAKEAIAKQLGISRATIYRRIREYGLDE